MQLLSIRILAAVNAAILLVPYGLSFAEGVKFLKLFLNSRPGGFLFDHARP